MSVRLLVFALALAIAPSAHAQDPGPEAIAAQIAAARGEVERASVVRDRVSVEVEALVAQREAAQRRLRDRVNALYRMRRAGLLPLAEGFDALLRHRARMQRLEQMVARDLDALRALERRVAALRDEGARAAGEAEQAEATLRVLREREAALQTAMLGAYPAESWGLRLSDGAAFAEARGALPMPVGGSAQVSDGAREGGRGLEIVATGGAQVRAVAAGRVAYAASHPAYGPLVILDHGGGYYSVYGGLGALGVQVGAMVGAEAILGAVGATPVFFQVRRGTRPLPAREWLGI